nr:FAD-dependent oxidoreductase [Streptomyces ochraceiscleroticus]
MHSPGGQGPYRWPPLHRAGRRHHHCRYRSGLATSFSHNWRRAPHLEAAWHHLNGGPDDAAFAALNVPAGRVHFAGDHLSHTDAWQHGAFSSARKVVMALHERVMT